MLEALRGGKFVRLLLVVASWLYGINVCAREQPRIDPAEDQSVVIENSEATINFTAAGGECVPPDFDADGHGGKTPEAAGWQRDGDAVYVWSYENGPDGVSGSPASGEVSALDTGDKQDTLRLNTNEGGSSSVVVYALQRWKTGDSRIALTRSPIR